MTAQFFTGDERLEQFEALGKLMRMGSLDQLGISDEKRYNDLIKTDNFSEARKYLQVFEEGSIGMTALSFHWIQSYSLTLVAKKDVDEARKLLSLSFEHYKKNSTTLRTSKISKEVASYFDSIINPEVLTTDQAQINFDALAQGKMECVNEVRKPIVDKYQVILEVLDSKDREKSLSAFSDYRDAVRTLHDLIFEYTHSISTVCAQQVGETFAQEVVATSFTQLPTYEGLWSLLATWNPHQITAWLAEHLRDHFSGTNREGAVEIIEDDDKYRLVFAPCGSGGALKKRHTKNGGDQYFFKEACPSTWGKADVVTPYCTHCAVNEITSIKKLGYPLWVTEYKDDPNEPCGWTVYKDAAKIPAEFFERLGFRKSNT